MFCGTAQNITIRGTITDNINSEVLPYVNIYLKNSTQGTTTNLDGKFSLQFNSNTDDSLCFSYMGYNTFFIPISGIANNSNLVIRLIKSNLCIEEVPVLANVEDLLQRAVKQHIKKIRSTNIELQFMLRHFIINPKNNNPILFKEINLRSEIKNGKIHPNKMNFFIEDYNCIGEMSDYEKQKSDLSLERLINRGFNLNSYFEVLKRMRARLRTVVYLHNKKCFLIEVPADGIEHDFVDTYLSSYNNKELQFFNWVWNQTKNYGQLLFFISAKDLSIEKMQYLTIYPGFNLSCSVEYTHLDNVVYPKIIRYTGRVGSGKELLMYSDLVTVQLFNNEVYEKNFLVRIYDKIFKVNNSFQKGSISKFNTITNKKRRKRKIENDNLFFERDSLSKKVIEQIIQ